MSRVLNSSIGPVRRFSKLRCLKKQNHRSRWFKVIFWSLNVGGHVYNLFWKGRLTILKRVTLESPGKQTFRKQKLAKVSTNHQKNNAQNHFLLHNFDNETKAICFLQNLNNESKNQPLSQPNTNGGEMEEGTKFLWISTMFSSDPKRPNLGRFPNPSGDCEFWSLDRWIWDL